MKLKLSVITYLFVGFSMLAQVTNQGEPTSWNLNLSNDGVSVKSLPQFDMNQVKVEDLINDEKPDSPWRFGYSHSVDFGLEDGTWTELDNGDRIWRLLVSSPGALSLNFIFLFLNM